MMRFSFWVAACLALGLTVGPAWYHGQRNFRWGEDQVLVDIAQRLEKFPKQIGTWLSVKSLELQPIEVDQLRPAGYLARTYASGDLRANVFILLGPTGPTAVHTPDICFNSRDYRSLGPRQSVKIHDSSVNWSNSWVSRFRSIDLDQHCIKTWYAWTVDGTWQASTNPRVEFVNSRYLIKIQISVAYPDQEAMDNDKLGEGFVKLIEQHLTSDVLNK